MMSCCSVDVHEEIKGWNEKAETDIWDKIKAERSSSSDGGVAVTSSSSTAVGVDKTTDATMALCRDKDKNRGGGCGMVMFRHLQYRWKRQRFTTMYHLTFLQPTTYNNR